MKFSISFLVAMAISIASLVSFSQNASAHPKEVSSSSCGAGWYWSGSSCKTYYSWPTLVERVIFSGQTESGYYGEVQVFADGQWVGNIGLPANNSSVWVNRKVSNIEVRFGSKTYLREMSSYVESDEHYYPEEHSPKPNKHVYENLGTPRGMADAVLDMVAFLQEDLSDADFAAYLKPIRIAALKMAASAGGRPYLSEKTGDRATTLVEAIEHANPLLERLADRERYRPTIEELWEVRERVISNYEKPIQ